GMGPICAGKGRVNSMNADAFDDPDTMLQGVGTLQDTGLVCLRRADGTPSTNVLLSVCYHSDRFEWGYNGSGPAELALNVLAALMPMKDKSVSPDAWRLHNDFCAEFIAVLPHDGGTIPIDRINEWLIASLT